MIWIEFHRQGEPATNVFLKAGVILIQVCTRPPVEGLTITGTIQVEGNPAPLKQLNLTAGPDDKAVYADSFNPPGPGVYKVNLTATKRGYRDAELSQTFYCRW